MTLNADTIKITVIIARLTLCNFTFSRRRPRYCLFPQPAVAQYFLNNIRLAFIDKADDIHLSTTIRTAHPRKSLPQISAFKKLVDSSADDRPPKTISGLEPLVVNPLERVKMVTHQSEKGRNLRIAGPVQFYRRSTHAIP